MTGISGRIRRAAEFLLLFVGGPLAILALHRAGVLFGLLWAAAALAWISQRGATAPQSGQTLGAALRTPLLRFIVLAPLIMIAAWIWSPQTLFSLPREKPGFWLVIVVLYPLLSVWPQEMLYRSFLFRRYGGLFGGDRGTIAASALAFGFAHILFLNWIAIAMTTIGGLLFARDYARHRDLRVACIEHSLYGCLIFTIGLGRFFYTGAAWKHG
ncbi:CPBP family intramembrane metalloprotease [Acetobacter sacchari]|uniref:CPBP family intramembrane metalloprotease n=1 Tax=Acetobacter sacchari TaxID=2661687 RepID=A0ABS3LXZ6_9PROT|nr:CPBP family intramembrane glutamic endopeptidase [Acetobacter sacchari]MBO1360795.1 CPBP family intramembrane metalloprotease [Acetobacter sacchari]